MPVLEQQTRGVEERDGVKEGVGVGRLGLLGEGGGEIVSLVSHVLKC